MRFLLKYEQQRADMDSVALRDDAEKGPPANHASSPEVEPSPVMIQELGRYRILEKLGEGTLGTVYRATDEVAGRAVAIRTIGEGIKWNPAERSRFCRECQSIAALQHPKIAAIYDLVEVEEEEIIHIVTEFLPGKSLGALINQKAEIPEEAKLSVMVQVVEGFEHAHKCGILHRDVKPSSIHVEPDGTAKIVDFGLAFLLGPYLARPSVRWGAPIYLSPEQVQGKNYDERSEIFSAGIVFWELVTGVHPFYDKDGNKTLDNILYAAPLQGPEQFSDTSPKVRSILTICLEKDPADRYKSMADLADDCREALEEVVEDSEFMQIELQMALPRLKKAIESPGAPAELATLLKDIQSLINSDRKADYGSLNRLMSTLSSHYPTIKAALKAPSPICLAADSPQDAEDGSPIADLTVAPGPSPGLYMVAPQQDPEVSGDRAERCATKDSTSATGTADFPQAAAIPMESQSSCKFEAPGTAAPAPQAPDITAYGGPNTPDENVQTAKSPFFNLQGSEDPDIRQTEGPAVLPPVVLRGKDQEPEVEGGFGQPERHSDDSTTDEVSKPEPAIGSPKGYRKSIILYAMWAAVGILALSLSLSIVAGYKIHNRSLIDPASLSGVRAGRQEQPSGNGSPSGGAGGADDPAQGNETTADALLKEAQRLVSQGRFEEGKALIRRVLDLHPTHAPAIAALQQLKVESYARLLDQQEKQVRSLLSSASSLIRAGKLQTAKAKLDEAEQLRPDSPELATLRKRWEARNSETARDLALKEAALLEDARMQKAEQTWSRQVEYLYRQGKYPEAQSLMERWFSENPGSSQAREWRARTGEAQKIIQEFNSAFNERKYREALNALARLEQTNPIDPNVSELRRQVESRKAGAKSVLTVYRLGEAATLALDGRPLGTNGEVENESITIGSHTLAVDGKNGSHITRSHEFLDGQRIAFVYDTVQPSLRIMSDADRELVSNRRKREQVSRFALEHSHGVFRGSCRGELLLSYSELEYRPSTGSHGFRVPFLDLRLKTHGRSIELLLASENKAFQSFKVQDESEANNLRQLWDNLEALHK